MSASAAFSAISAGTSLASGFSKRAAFKSEAKSLEFQAQGERLRGKQISSLRRSQLADALSSLDTIRSDRGLGIDSPGGVNIRRQIRKNAAENENAEVLSSKFRETDLRTQAAAKRRAAPFALLGGVANAAPSLADFFEQI